MKKLFFLAALVCSLLVVQTTNAQNPITTLQHKGGTTVFYGQGSLVDAYNTSVNGDTLYLSTGFFTAPGAIAKGVKIIGAGHFPDSTNVAKRTYILSGLTINAGADSLRLEGMYIDGDINYASTSSINYIKVVRCRVRNVNFQSNSATASKNYCSYEECFIDGSLNFSNYGTTLSVFHSIISGMVNAVSGGALIEGNIFLVNNNYPLYYVTSSIIKNNIFLANSLEPLYYCTGNLLNNNIFVKSSPNWGTNSYSNNFIGVTQATIFINQTGNTIDYTHDYHLKTPATYLGTDGTQVGLYSGATPFKDKGFPSNPQVIKKNIAAQTDANGNLQINFSAKAQDR